MKQMKRILKIVKNFFVNFLLDLQLFLELILLHVQIYF